ncbi:response regulator [Elusimicrobiota bacterium]
MNKRILIVDDELSILIICEKFLSRQGYNITTANSLDDFKTIFEENNFDLVLSDFNINRESGLEVLSIVKNKAPSTGVIIMSGSLLNLDMETILSKNNAPDAFLTKPFEKDELVGTVNSYFSEVCR